jgi:hypothetical protein
MLLKLIIIILVYIYQSQVEGKHACVNLVGVFSLMGLTTSDFIVAQTDLEVASNKVANMRNHVLIINMRLYILHLTLLVF